MCFRYTSTQTSTCTQASAQTCTQACTQTCTQASTQTCTQACTQTCTKVIYQGLLTTKPLEDRKFQFVYISVKLNLFEITTFYINIFFQKNTFLNGNHIQHKIFAILFFKLKLLMKLLFRSVCQTKTKDRAEP